MPTPKIPPTLGSKVTTREFSWSEMVERAWGSEWNAPDHRIYEFAGYIFKDSTDKYQTGIYSDHHG